VFTWLKFFKISFKFEIFAPSEERNKSIGRNERHFDNYKRKNRRTAQNIKVFMSID
jgi:hypothetical protein